MYTCKRACCRRPPISSSRRATCCRRARSATSRSGRFFRSDSSEGGVSVSSCACSLTPSCVRSQPLVVRRQSGSNCREQSLQSKLQSLQRSQLQPSVPDAGCAGGFCSRPVSRPRLRWLPWPSRGRTRNRDSTEGARRRRVVRRAGEKTKVRRARSQKVT